MEHPRGVPSVIVAMCRELETLATCSEQSTAAEQQRLEIMTDDAYAQENHICSKQCYLKAREEVHKQDRSELAYYKRLIADSRATEVWDRLRCLADAMPFVIADLDSFLLGYVQKAWQLLGKAEDVTLHTPVGKKEHLAEIKEAAKELMNKLDRSPYLDCRWLIAGKITGEDLSLSHIGTGYAAAMNDWFLERDRRHESDMPQSFDSHWLLGQYGQVSVMSVLGWVVESCNDQVSVPPIVTKTTGTNVVRNVYARLLYDFHIESFDDPAWELMPSVIAVVLDLPGDDSLTASSVRKIVRPDRLEKNT